MSISFSTNVRIFLALMQRDLKVIGTKLKDQLFNRLLFLCLQMLLFAGFMPMMGMSRTLIASLCIGEGLILSMVMLCFNLTVLYAFDFQARRNINYHFTLPLPKHWLFAQYIGAMILEVIINTLPLILLNVYILRDAFITPATSWPLFILAYLISALFISTFLLTASASLTLNSYLDHIWPRILSPLMFTSARTFSWITLSQFWYPLGIAALCSPFTYIGEAWRATLLGHQYTLPLWVSLSTLLLFTGICLAIAHITIHRRFDPV